jgi:GNAT superfamily N-acetyltransferase
MDPTRVLELDEAAPAARTGLLRRAYDEVLAPAFPPAELLTLADLAAAVAAEPPTALVALAGDPGDGGDGVGTLRGCVVGQWFARSEVLLIAYLAVTADRRGRGTGTALITAAVGRWARRLGARLVVAEVEDPAVHPASEGQDPVGRLRLYGRLGAKVLDIPYAQPEINRGLGRVADMLLIVAPELSPAVASAADGSADVPSPLLVAFLAEYFAAVEGPGHDDDDFRHLIAAAAARPAIPLVAVDR